MRYDELRSHEIISTLEHMEDSIRREFPKRGLAKIAAEMHSSAMRMDANIARILSRAGSCACLAFFLARS